MQDNVLAILAGGFSRRYQDKEGQFIDKALLSINNVTILLDLIKRGFQFYDEVSISVNSLERKHKYEQILGKETKQPSRIVIDKKMKIKGVLRGIISTIKENQDKNIQFIPVDRPFIDLNLLNKITRQEKGISLFHYDNGLLEPLLASYGAKFYFPPEIDQLQLSRADVLIRICPQILLYNIDSIIETNQLPSYIFANINVQSDLSVEKPPYDSTSINLPKPRLIIRKDLPKINLNLIKKDFQELIHELVENEHYYFSFLLFLYLKQNSKLSSREFQSLAYNVLESEYRYWLNENMDFLALHALQDQIEFCSISNNQKKLKEISKLKKKMGIKSRIL
jgi:molybdopterin-guanine dinucleotide biosynthesis protein A